MLKTRVGLSCPARISQIETATPPCIAKTVRDAKPVPSGAARRAFNVSTCLGSRTIGRPCESRKASSVVTASAGMSSSAVSTGSRTSKPPPVDLDGRIDRRNLGNGAHEGFQGLRHHFGLGTHVGAGDDLAFPVQSGRRRAPFDHEAVGLARIHHERDGLGGFAQGDRQDSCGQGVKRAGVAGLLRLEKTPHPAHPLGGTQV